MLCIKIRRYLEILSDVQSRAGILTRAVVPLCDISIEIIRSMHHINLHSMTPFSIHIPIWNEAI